MRIPFDFETIVDDLHDGLYLVDRNRVITYWNKAAEQITGYSSEEVIGRPCADNILIHVDSAGKELCKAMCSLTATMEDGKPREAEVYFQHKSGHRLPVIIRVTPLKNEQGEIMGGIELFSENTHCDALRIKLTEMQKFALLDPLTELPNRRHLESQIYACFAHLERDDIPFGLLFIDVDHFKRFNDSYGHIKGDVALQTIAKTIMHSVRPFDTVARWGGEEFAGVFPNADAQTLMPIAERICALVRHSHIETGSLSHHLTVSIGGALAKRGDTVASLTNRADIMMYRSKQEGRNRVNIEGRRDYETSA
ncbi:MAG: sensor domain-containing diguanylate cyclase [Syntrophales bacterium]|nr:sensor domain-containing diguanylate cyclase [Syntrophales bacterium]